MLYYFIQRDIFESLFNNDSNIFRNSPAFFFFNRKFRNGFNRKFNSKDLADQLDISGDDESDSNQQDIFDKIDMICFILSCFGYNLF